MALTEEILIKKQMDNLTPSIKPIFILSIVILFAACAGKETSSDMNRPGRKTVCVEPGKPTQIVFPQKIMGGMKDGPCHHISIDRIGNQLIVFVHEKHKGCRLPLYLLDGTRVEVDILLADEKCPRDKVVVME